MEASENTLKLPDGYTIEPYGHSADETLLVLRRADGSAAALFEFSAFGPGPTTIWEVAWNDFEVASYEPHRGKGAHEDQ